MFVFIIKNKATKEIDKLSPNVRRRILEKLKFFSEQENPLKCAERLNNFEFGEYRFRVSDYRILFDVQGNNIVILKVGHRKDIYK